MRTLHQKLLSSLSLIFMLGLFQSASAAPQTVWRIGTFNQSPSEFNTGNKGAPLFGSRYPKGELVYIVGKSKPEMDWPAYQEGATLGKTGSHPHPYTIQFDLDQIPQGVYTLKIGLLSETARVAVLQVEINGHAGIFYQHPKLNYGGGDRQMVTLPIAAVDTITFDLPTKLLQKGTNKLTLTAGDESTAENEETHSIVTYDAIELDHDAAGKFPANAITAETEPTIFYVRQGEGLSELVDVYVRYNSAVERGQVTLALGGKEIHQPLSAKEFGEQKVEFSVPEFTTPLNGAVTVKIGGHAQRSPVTLTPAKKWNLLVVPHIHVDVGYTDYQEKVAEIQSRVLEEAIQLIQEHPDFRFSPDGFWSVRQFVAGRSEERQQRLSQMVKEKKIFIPTVEASLLTGFPSLETLIRSLYPAFQFNQKNGGDADYADITDVPAYSWSYASVMAAAGLKYFISGCDNDNGPILLASRLNEKSPFWWEGPDGGRILMWYSWVYAQLGLLFGGPQGEIPAGHDAIPVFLQAYTHPEYKSDSVLVYGTQGENTDLFPRQASIADDWNKLYAYPHLQYSGFADAMRTIAASFGDSIPVVRADGGPYWEYGIVSTARSAAIDRESEQRALAAEEFSTVTSLVNPGARPEPEVLKRIWNNMVLYGEHTWGSYLSVSDPKSRETIDQLAVKEAFATDAKRDVDYVLRRSLADLANSIYDPHGTLLVFNPLSWQRSSLVEIDLDKGQEIVDLATNQPVSYEVLSTGESYRHIRFLAQDVPSVGYKAYTLKEIQDAPPSPPAVSGETLENQFYRVVLDAESGAVKSIFDKELNKELVNTSSPYRFDQYLYVTGGDQSPNRLLEYSATWPIPELTIHNAGGGHLVSVTNEPFGVAAWLESSGVNTPKIETEVILFNGQKKIEFINHVRKTEVYTKEGIYFAFPLAMDQPRFRYEIQNGVVNPAHDQMPGAGKEWFSVQHWVAADQGGVTAAIIPVDAFLVTLGDIMRGKWPREFGQRPGTIFSQVMNNYYFTNYAAGQGGDFTFRYVLTSGTNLEPAHLSRVGREEMSPLEVDQITSQDKAINAARPFSSAQGSFLKVDQADVALVTWKAAEDGKGTILRFLELAGKSAEANVETPLLDVQAAWRADALERNQEPLATSPHGFRFAVKPFQIVTIRVEGTSAIK
jgi:alpha-mannosidase